MIRRHAAALHIALMAVDAIGAVVLFVLTSVVVTAVRFPGTDWRVPWLDAGLDPWIVAAFYAAAWVGLLWLQGLYRLRIRWSIRREFGDILRSALFLAVATFTVLFLLKLPDVSRFLLLALFTTQLAVTLAGRLAIRGLAVGLRARGRNTRYLLVIGVGPAARSFADRVEARVDLGLSVIGHLAPIPGDATTPIPETVGGRLVLGQVTDIERTLHDRIVDEVAICLPLESLELVEPITRLCEEEGKIVRIPGPPAGLTIEGGRLESFDGLDVLSLVYGPDRAISLILKRLLDIVGAAAALIALSPVFVAIGATIVTRDGRPVLFRQQRVGLHGRLFTLVKFRTMVPDAEARLGELLDQNELRGHVFKITEDPRLSRTGRWLRRTSLDELPQFWNVLRGEMSLVGPRPPLPREVAAYDLWHRRRLSMKPGMTGLWQVSARGEEDFDRWVALDLDYIDRWSIWLDLKIMLRTIPAMLQGR